MEKLTQHILVPLDFSDAAGLALDAAGVLARQNQARVTLCHVLDPQPLGPRGTKGEAGADQVLEEAEVEQTIHDELRREGEEALGELPFQTAIVLNTNAAMGICDYAKKEDVDLIVVSTHGRTGLAHMLIGSVAERVVRHAPCPVMTLRSHAKD